MKTFDNLKRYLKKITTGPDFDDGMALVCEFVLSCLKMYPSRHLKDISALERFIEIVRNNNNVQMITFPKASNAGNPYLGLCATRSPIWAQSPVSHANHAAKEGYARLVGCAVSHTVIVLRKKGRISDSYLTVLAAGYRGLRALSESGAAEIIFRLENERYSSMEEAITDVTHTDINCEYSASISAVSSMLKLLKGERKIHTKYGSDAISDRHTKWVHGHLDEFIFENSDEYFDCDEVDETTEIMTVNDVGDEGEGIDFVITDIEAVKCDSKQKLPEKLRDRYQALNIGKANQKLLYGWNVMTPAEHQWLIDKILVKDFKGDIRGLLLLALLSGKDLEQLVQTRVVSQDSAPEFELEYVHETHQLRLRVKRPNIKPSHSRAFIPTQSHVLLNMPLTQFSNNGIGGLSRNCTLGERLFDIDIFQAKEMMNKFLELQPAGYRITFAKIRSFAASMFANYSSDPAIGALIFDGVTPVQKTVRHYLTVSSGSLRDQYELALCKAGLKFPSVSKKIRSHLNNQWVGTGYRLKDSRLQLWITATCDRLKIYPVTRDEVISYHNLYTLYTIMMFSHAALWRGNKTPIPDNYRCESGFILMNDKAIGAGYSIRFNPLPADVIKQLHNYADHAGRVKASLNITSPKMMRSSSDFFLLTELGKPRAVRAGLLFNISPRFPGRRNALRLHMRSRLSELNIPGEALDAIMGHWHNGIEPYSCYSSISPNFVQTKVLPGIEMVMKEVGWSPIKSLVLS